MYRICGGKVSNFLMLYCHFARYFDRPVSLGRLCHWKSTSSHRHSDSLAMDSHALQFYATILNYCAMPTNQDTALQSEERRKKILSFYPAKNKFQDKLTDDKCLIMSLVNKLILFFTISSMSL